MSEHPSYEATHPYWAARLATGITLALGDIKQKEVWLAEKQLRALINEFLASPVASAELKRSLRELKP